MIAQLISAPWREPWVGLDIRNGTITAAMARRRGSRAPVLRRLAFGSYDPSGGDAAIVGALRKLWKRARFSTYSVCSCLHTHTVFAKAFRLRHVESGELASVLSLEAEQALAIEPGRIAMDWTLHAQPDESVTEGILVATSRAEIDRQLHVYRRAGLYPLVMDAPGMAIAHLYQLQVGQEASRGTAVIAIDEYCAECVTIAADGFLLPRSVQWAGRRLSDSPNDLAREIAETLRFATRSVRKSSVERIALAGCPRETELLADAIAAKTGLPVAPWRPMDGFRVSVAARRALRAADADAISRAVVCLGLALREDRRAVV